MKQKKIKAVVIKPGGIPRPIEIENDILALGRAVNIDRKGNPHPDFEPFEVSEIIDDINIISSPKGKERSLPVTRTVGRYSKFYGIIYIVKMRGFDLVSMTTSEAIDWCVKFMDKTIPIERLGLPPLDYGDEVEKDDGYRRIDITFDEW